MPRRRTQPDEITNLDIVIERPKDVLKVSTYLKNTYYDLCLKAEADLQCTICLDKIDCKRCMCLLVCGHFYHRECVEGMKEAICPICRS